MTLSEIPLREAPVVEPSTSLEEAIDLLQRSPLKTVVLVGDGMYMGVLNIDALQSGLIPAKADKSELQVGPYVHPQRVIGRPDSDLDDVLASVRRNHIDVIPVVSGTIYKGVLTREDLEIASRITP